MEILHQRDAASHDSGEFGIVHHVAAGVVGEVFFYDFFSNPANAGGNAGQSCGVPDCFHKLVVRHVDIIEKLFFQIANKIIAARLTQKLSMYQFTPIIQKIAIATFTHDFLFYDGLLRRSRNYMPGQFQRLNCEVNPEKSYSTDCSSFNESLNNNHCYENQKKSLIDQSSLSIVQNFSPIFL